MIIVSIAASPALYGHNFTVESFDNAIRQPMAAVREVIIQIIFMYVGFFFDRI